MITLPFTQVHLFVSMIISEILLVSDPNYTVRIGSENYFSLAVGLFVGIIFLSIFITIKFGSKVQFRVPVSEPKIHKERVAYRKPQLIMAVAN